MRGAGGDMSSWPPRAPARDFLCPSQEGGGSVKDMKYLRFKCAPYLVPALVVAAVGAGAMVPALSSASPPPLPAQAPEQLLVDMAHAQPPELSGSVELTVNLGLSDLSSLEGELGQGGGGSSGFNPVSLLSGSNQINVWLGQHAEHLAMSESTAEEVDLVRNGDQAWLWDSSTGTVDHLVAPAGPTGSSGAPVTSTSLPPLTPQQLATDLLARIGPTTSVTTGGTIDVAGQAAYRLLVAPKDAPGSTISHVEIDVGASGTLAGVPLRVGIYPVGQTGVALELGFTGQISLGPPAASELTFTPPPGAEVVTHDLGSNGSSDRSGVFGNLELSRTGRGWATVVTGNAPRLTRATAQSYLAPLTAPVQVAGQQARLLGTDLLNILLMPDGHFYAGFVTPAVLEADASAAP